MSLMRTYSRTDGEANTERHDGLVPLSLAWVDAETEQARACWERSGRTIPLSVYTARWVANAMGFILE